MVIVAQLYKYTKIIKLYTINEWALWYVKYISIKLLKTKERYEDWLTQLQGSNF